MNIKGTINGVVKNVLVTFNVKKPEVTMVVSKNDPPEIVLDLTKNRITLEKTVAWDRHGQAQEGEIAWVQLISETATILYDVEHFDKGPGFQYFYGSGLDDVFPYTKDPVLTDVPATFDDLHIALSIWRNDTFESWIMFKHKDEGSI